MIDENLQITPKSLADRSKDILLGYPLANWSDNLRQLHIDMLARISELEGSLSELIQLADDCDDDSIQFVWANDILNKNHGEV